MKALVALVGLVTASLHSGRKGQNSKTIWLGEETVESDYGALSTWFTGEADVVLKIRAYNATRYIAPGQGSVPRGTRILFICDVEGLPEGNVVISYTWYHSSTSTGRSEIRRGDPYYTPVNDTLLVDTTSWGAGTRRHICEVSYLGEDGRSHKQSSFISISPTGNLS